MAVEHLTSKPSDGTNLGQDATDLIGFYGKAPIVQPTSANQAAITTGATTTATINLVNELRNQLVNLGLVKGS